MAVEERIREVVEPVVRGAGLFLENIVAPAGRRSLLRVVVDLEAGPGGVDADRLGDVAREISAALDEDDVVPGSYTLEVTTPGIDRPLTTERHFGRAVGRLLSVRTADGTLRGRLREADGDAIVLETDSGTRTVGLAMIVKAKVEPDLRSGGR